MYVGEPGEDSSAKGRSCLSCGLAVLSGQAGRLPAAGVGCPCPSSQSGHPCRPSPSASPFSPGLTHGAGA